MGQVDDGGDDGVVGWVVGHCADESAVDFEAVEGEAVQTAEGGVAGAEVVDIEGDAQGA